MDFTFTAEQAMLRDTVARYLRRDYDFDARQAIVGSPSGWSVPVWRRLGELGLLALPFPEEVGGLGGSVVDVVAVGELFGEHLLVEPYIASVVMAGGALAAAPADASGWLARVVEGQAIGAFAHEEGLGTPDPALVATLARRTAGGWAPGDWAPGEWALTGDKKLVLHGADADVVIVTARVGGRPGDRDGLALFAFDATGPGMTATPFVTVDGRRAAHLSFADAPVELLASEAYPLVREVVDRAILALAAEAVGAMGALLRRTAGYAATREQFGVPIGTFQAVAHRLADMKIGYVKARSTLLYTAALAEARRVGLRDIAVLKAQVGRLGRLLGEASIQTHGGVGMTDELPIGHLHKRILAVEAMFGATDHHLRTIGAAPRRDGGVVRRAR